MSELRRSLLDDSDAPPELSADLAFLGARNAAAAALLLHHAEVYRLLLDRYREEGPSEDIEEIALEAAGNMATVLQAMRRRDELLTAMRYANLAAPPMIVIDQLFFSFLLMTGPGDEDDVKMLLSGDDLDELLALESTQAWLKSMQADSH
jgi:hypothetical protein